MVVISDGQPYLDGLVSMAAVGPKRLDARSPSPGLDSCSTTASSCWTFPTQPASEQLRANSTAPFAQVASAKSLHHARSGTTVPLAHAASAESFHRSCSGTPTFLSHAASTGSLHHSRHQVASYTQENVEYGKVEDDIDFEDHCFSDAEIERLITPVDKWDSINLSRTVAEIFAQANQGSGNPTLLEWHASEVHFFVRMVYQAHFLPAPSLTASQWQSLLRSFQRTDAPGLTMDESVKLVEFLHTKIQNGDADLHQIFNQQVTAHPEVKRQAMANDWRQKPVNMALKAKKLDLDAMSPIVLRIFAELDRDGDGSLQWQQSEISEFAKQFLRAQGLPVPPVPDEVWYQWFREVDYNGDGQMDLAEAAQFSKHILERILQLRGLPLPGGAQPVADARRVLRNASGAIARMVAVAKPPTAPRRILLTSSGLSVPSFRSALATLLQARKPSGKPTVLYIPDAAVGNGCDASVTHCNVANQFMLLGVSNVVCIELRHATPEHLARALEGVDCIYVEMGNTFYLRHCMRLSGFDQMVPPMVRNEGVVYVGSSAGSMCAGRTIGVAFWKGWDDPGYGKEWDLQRYGYDGLNLLPDGKSVFPHYGKQWSDLVEKKRRELGDAVVVLDEEHAYLVNGDSEELIGASTRQLSIISPLPSSVVVVSVPKPLELILGDRPGGGVQVSLLKEGGAARATGLIKRGDRLMAVCGQDVQHCTADNVKAVIASAPRDVCLMLRRDRRFDPGMVRYAGC